ncbi:lipopolysaccharide biosynthesis protein [Vibrio alfacsensis]|uniref:lipopolysaccharide biosynthesis protein n=1 Tax=Vibrio alfacsensis TaxID=1074311 RepID=UPI0040682797
MHRDSTLKSIVTLVTGTASAQVLALICAPIITRLYGPSAFGALSVYNSIVATLLPLCALSLPLAIVVAKENRDAKRILWTCIVLASIFCVSILVFNYGVLVYFLDKFNVGIDKSDLIYFPFGLFFTCTLEALYYWLLRNKLFRLKSKVVFLQAIIVNSLKILVGFLYPNPYTLIISTIIGVAVSIVIIVRTTPEVLSAYKENYLRTFKVVKVSILKYPNYPKFRTAQGLFTGLNQAIPIFFLTMIYGAKAAGYFALCRTIMSLPVNLIAKSVSDVLYPNITEKLANGQNAFEILLKSTVTLAIVALPITAVIFYFGDILFSIFFGSEWITSGKYAKWFVIFLFFNFINRPAIAAVPGLKLEKNLLVNSFINTLIISSVFFVSAKNNLSDIESIKYYSMSLVCSQSYLIYITFKRSKVRK